ncbi:MAG: ABC transporter substrate-binding protein [Rhizobiales bacterium]|nr:ABC transporter substrate-binding protein [Hyphomicrobiales bacterium]
MSEKPRIRLGFMPLLDAAIPIVAAEMGFADRRGIAIDLVRESSWANIRDRLAIGHFEAAHALAPMPIAAALGLTPFEAPLIAPMMLGLGGNAITVSESLWGHMRSVAPEARVNDPRDMGRALKAAIAARAAGGLAPLVFAVVHPYSSHNYELRYWLAACGIDPDRDIRIAIVPPPFMPDALASGRIDGFCVGEPWNTRAARLASGCIILTKAAIWHNSPEKALALNAGWAAQKPDIAHALLVAVLEAAQWCEAVENRAQLAEILGRPDRLDVPATDLLPALRGQLGMADGLEHAVPDMLVFAANQANMPWKDHALWYLAQMRRWGQTDPGPAEVARVTAAFRPDLYREAAKALGASAPRSDLQPVSEPGEIEGTAGVLHYAPSAFFDDSRFDPAAFVATCERAG